MNDAPITGEKALWIAVLQQAIHDATHGPNSQVRAVDHSVARTWFTVPNKDFNEVCHLAGLDPVAVREHMRRKLQISEETGLSTKAASRPTRKPRGRPHTANGMTMTISEWAVHMGIKRSQLDWLLRKHGSMEAVLDASKISQSKGVQVGGGSLQLT